MPTSHLRPRFVIAGLCVFVVGLSACGSTESPSVGAPNSSESVPPSVAPHTAEPQTTEPETTSPDPTLPDTTLPDTTVPERSEPSSGGVEILGIYPGVHAYPACGNESLDHLGVTWYPLVHTGYDPIDTSLQPRVDAIFDVEREEPPDARFQGLVRVMEPGPGDDIGTLVVWADGVARWISDSGDLDVWMIDDEIEYMWLC